MHRGARAGCRPRPLQHVGRGAGRGRGRRGRGGPSRQACGDGAGGGPARVRGPAWGVCRCRRGAFGRVPRGHVRLGACARGGARGQGGRRAAAQLRRRRGSAANAAGPRRRAIDDGREGAAHAARCVSVVARWRPGRGGVWPARQGRAAQRGAPLGPEQVKKEGRAAPSQRRFWGWRGARGRAGRGTRGRSKVRAAPRAGGRACCVWGGG
jgi:hypothetical protein